MPTAPFDRYIRTALKNPSAEIFQTHPTNSPPTLRSDKVNRVIFYRGSFNPPHEGHKDALCHAFFRAGDDLNIIAAFIFLLEEADVKRKPQMKVEGAFMLSKNQRMQLWNTGGVTGGWHWCYTSAANEKFNPFWRRLQSEAQKDGYELELIYLLGPDHISKGAASGKTLTCGTADRATFIEEGGSKWLALPNHGDWQDRSPDLSALRRLATEGSTQWLEDKLKMLHPEQTNNLPDEPTLRRAHIERRLQTYTRRLGAVKVCHHLSNPAQSWLRFVPTRFIGSQGGSSFIGKKQVAVSSTLIRNVIYKARSGQDAIIQLRGVAVNPHLLLDLIYERYPHHPCFVANNGKKRKALPEVGTVALSEAGFQPGLGRGPEALWSPPTLPKPEDFPKLDTKLEIFPLSKVDRKRGLGRDEPRKKIVSRYPEGVPQPEWFHMSKEKSKSESKSKTRPKLKAFPPPQGQEQVHGQVQEQVQGRAQEQEQALEQVTAQGEPAPVHANSNPSSWWDVQRLYKRIEQFLPGFQSGED